MSLTLADLQRKTTAAAVRDVESIPVAINAKFAPEYAAALKLCLLQVQNPKLVSKPELFRQLLQWMYDDFMFVPGALSYGSLALSPSRHGRMFKSLWSGDVDKALRGVRNASYDMGILREWQRRTKRGPISNEFSILCSFDQAMLDCASDLLAGGSSHESGFQTLTRRWQREWGLKVGGELADFYAHCLMSYNIDRSRASLRHKNDGRHWRDLTTKLEAEFVTAVQDFGGHLTS